MISLLTLAQSVSELWPATLQKVKNVLFMYVLKQTVFVST